MEYNSQRIRFLHVFLKINRDDYNIIKLPISYPQVYNELLRNVCNYVCFRLIFYVHINTLRKQYEQ
jgi:hypothetical protein